VLHIRIDSDRNVVEVCAENFNYNEVSELRLWARKQDGTLGIGWLNRNDIEAMYFAEELAAGCTKLTGDQYVAVDNGDNVSPRYDVCKAPKIGDDVSKGFNGDYYYVGKVVKVSKDLRIVHTLMERNGAPYSLRFYRRKQTAAWIQAGGTWCLVPGVRNELNPHF